MAQTPQSSKLNWTAIFGCLLLLTGPSWGQTASTDNSAALKAFQQEQQALARQMNALLAQGATSQQIQAWQQQHAADFAALRQQAQALSAASASQPLPLITQVTAPEGATQEMEDFMVAQAQLANSFAQMHNQQVQNGSTNAAPTAAAMAAFQQQNAEAIQAQQQRAQVLAAQSAAKPMPVPPPLVIPPGSTPQMQAFLTLRDQLVREQIQVHNQNMNATAAVQEAAMQQWQQQNAARSQQLQQLAQNLSATSSH